MDTKISGFHDFSSLTQADVDRKIHHYLAMLQRKNIHPTEVSLVYKPIHQTHEKSRHIHNVKANILVNGAVHHGEAEDHELITAVDKALSIAVVTATND